METKDDGDGSSLVDSINERIAQICTKQEEETSSPLRYVTGTFSNRFGVEEHVQFLCDSGGSKSCFSFDYYAHYLSHLKLEPYSITIKGYTCNTVESIGIVYVPFKLGISNFCHPFVIVPGASHKALLGGDWFERYKADISYRQNSLTFDDVSGVQKSVPIVSQKLIDSCHKISVAKHTVIPALCEVVISATVEDGDLLHGISGEVERNMNLFNKRNLVAARTLCTVRDGEIPVRLLNPVNKPITLWPGTNLGSFVHVEHVINLIGIGDEPNPIDKPFSSKPHPALDLSFEKEVSNTERQTMVNLLASYKDLFTDDINEVGRVRHFEFDIETRGPPFQHSPYAMNKLRREKLMEHLNKMVECRMFKPGTSAWNSPVFIVEKRASGIGKQTKWQPIIDYRTLNARTKNLDSSKVPICSKLLEEVAPHKWFSVLDLTKGYHQIPLSESAQQKACIVCPDGTTMLPTVGQYGLSAMVGAFSRLMQCVLGHLNYKVAASYLDDLIFYTNTVSEHIEALQTFFARAREYNISLSPSKCLFLKKRVSYLGHVISDGCIMPAEKKIALIKNFPDIPSCPDPRKSLSNFVGLANYYRKFCPDFSRISAPLYAAISSKGEFVWSPECSEAFKKLQQMLISEPVLKAPRFDLPFTLYCDACNVSIGHILAQEQPDENGQMTEYICSFGGRLLSVHEKHYPIYHLEFLSVIYALRYNEMYLTATGCKVVTDNKALSTLLQSKTKNNERLRRWAIMLSSFPNVTLVHRKGSDHANADAVSRFPYQLIKLDDPSWFAQNKEDAEMISVETQKDKKPQVSENLKCKPSKHVSFDIPGQQVKAAKHVSFDSSVLNDQEMSGSSVSSESVPSIKRANINKSKRQQRVTENKFNDKDTCLNGNKFLHFLIHGRMSQSLVTPCKQRPDSKNENISQKSDETDLSFDSQLNESDGNMKLSPNRDCPLSDVPFSDEMAPGPETGSEDMVMKTGTEGHLGDVSGVSVSDEVGAESVESSPEVFIATVTGTGKQKQKHQGKDSTGDLMFENDLGDITEEVLAQFQKDDVHEFSHMWAYLKGDKLPDDDKLAKEIVLHAENFHFHKVGETEILCYISKSRKKARFDFDHRICVPEVLQKRLIHRLHNSLTAGGGHCSRDRSLGLYRSKYYFKNATKMIHDICNECMTCQKRFGIPSRLNHPMEIRDAETYVNERVHMDHLQLCPSKSEFLGKTYKYCLILCDGLSKHLALYPCETVTAKETAYHLYKYVSEYGLIRNLVSDNQQGFHGTLLKELTSFLGIKHTFTLAHSPRGNGQVENYVAHVKKMLSVYCNKHEDWSHYLPLVQMSLNNCPQSTTGYSSNYIFFGRELCMNDGFTFQLEPEDVSEYDHVQKLSLRLQDACQMASENIAQDKLRNKKHFDRKVYPVQFEPGSIVFVHNPNPGKSDKSKSLKKDRYLGPFRVFNVQGTKVTLQNITTNKLEDKPVNIRRLKKGFLTNQGSYSPVVELPVEENSESTNEKKQEQPDEGKFYEVERILKSYYCNRRKTRMYLCLWKGYPRKYASYEPAKNLNDALLAAYHDKQDKE